MQPAKTFFTYINYYAVKYDNVVMHWGSYWFASLRLGKALQAYKVKVQYFESIST